MTSGGARDWYDEGVAAHYQAHGGTYLNPHAPIIDACVSRAAREWTLAVDDVLDLAAGSGELTRALLAVDPTARIGGCDPFTDDVYTRQTGRPCQRLSFEQIAAGAMRGQGHSLVGCSFAMHLCPSSMLPSLLVELAQIAPQLLILTPHKRPHIRQEWGCWSLAGEFVHERVRTRLYTSLLHASKIGALPTTLPAE